MKPSIKILAPSIYLYENVINFTENITELSLKDKTNWNIRNESANEWEIGKKIIGYDEYMINLNFFSNENFILLAKKIFDCAIDYADKNLTSIEGFDSFIIRKYSPALGFLELESSDIDNVSRKITAILFLNDVDDGGEVIFKNFNISVFPKIGSVIFFPASFAYSFKINKPKNMQSLVAISHFI